MPIIPAVNNFTTKKLVRIIKGLVLHKPDESLWPAVDVVVDALLDKADFHQEYEDLFNFFLEHKITNEMSLHTYIRLFLGWNVPRDVICSKRNHSSPFQFVSDMFFERTKNSIAFASRTAGKTLNLAILNHLDCVFKEGCEVSCCAATKDQSSRGNAYLRKMNTSSNVINDLLESKPTEKVTKFTNESSCELLTGTMEGVNSPHPHKARLDEVELMPWAVIQEALSMSMSSGGIMGQNCFSSTRKTIDGSFEALLKHAKINPNFKIYNWCCLESLERCLRECSGDKMFGDCSIWETCRGRAKRSRGFYDLTDFLDKCLSLSPDVLSSQWFNAKPTRKSLVYGDYWNPDVSIVSPDKIELEADFAIGCIDFGSTKESPLVFCQYLVNLENMRDSYAKIDTTKTAKPTIILGYEWRSSESDMEQLSKIIEANPFYQENGIILCDPSGKALRNELERYGITTFTPESRDISSGIELVKTYLRVYKDEDGEKKSSFYILSGYYDQQESDLIPTHLEFGKYRHKQLRDGSYSQTPLKRDDHGMDCLRYVISSLRSIIEELYGQIEEDTEALEDFEEKFGIPILE